MICSGGSPCQDSHVWGNGLALKDIRGTLFYDLPG